MFSEGSFAFILVVAILAVFLAVKSFEESNIMSEVATANVSTVIAFVELWVLSFLPHW
jgi:hypothetical protein